MDYKEDIDNSQRRKPATRIPVPKEPLPLIPEHLITKPKERKPLKTLISSNNVASTPSSQYKKQEKTNVTTKTFAIKCDLKHITHRARIETDWTKTVFKDGSIVEKLDFHNKITMPGPSRRAEHKIAAVNLNTSFSSVHNKAFLFLSDDEEKVELIIKAEQNKGAVQRMPCKNIKSQTVTVTPQVPIVHKAVKNVKKSLKRPHTRELQGILTPGKEPVRIEENNAKRRLLPYLDDAVKTPDYWKNDPYVLDIINYLLESENRTRLPRVNNDLRTVAVNWLIKINGAEGNPSIIQTACWYLDSMLGECIVSPAKLQVTASASFWIAQKMHGYSFKASKLAGFAKHAFTVADLICVEWRLLNKLKFPKQPVVPQEFIPYLSWWCDNSHPGEIELAATFICMCGMLVCRTLCLQYPSVVAAASVHNALRLLKKTQLIPRLEACHIYKIASEKERKSSHYPNVCTALRRAVVTVNSLKQQPLISRYNLPPSFIAHKIVTAAHQPDLIV